MEMAWMYTNSWLELKLLMMGIQATLITTRTRTKERPTTNSSLSEGRPLILVHMSMVKMVEEELKIEVREDISAAIITASIIPLAPEQE